MLRLLGRGVQVLMRAYQAADKGYDGLIQRREFRKLLHYLVYFNNLWHKFEEIDSDGDRRLSEAEFIKGCAVVGVTQLDGTGPKDLQRVFRQIDRCAAESTQRLRWFYPCAAACI